MNQPHPSSLLLGIEIGGTKLQAALGNEQGQLLGRARRSVDTAQGAAGIRHALVEMVEQLRSEAGNPPLRGVGIGFGGPLDVRRGVVLHSFQIAGWDEFPLRQWAEETWQAPAALANDAATAGLAEAHLGAGQGCSRLFYMTIGSGIGGGWIVGGRIDAGQGLGMAEVGHTYLPHPRSGEPVELESVCSGWAIGRRAREDVAAAGAPALMLKLAGSLQAVDARTVHAAAEQGDAPALRLLDETCATLGLALANVTALFHPQRIVIGGGVSLMGPLFWERLQAAFAARVLAPFASTTTIVPAALGEDVVLVGAVLVGIST